MARFSALFLGVYSITQHLGWCAGLFPFARMRQAEHIEVAVVVDVGGGQSMSRKPFENTFGERLRPFLNSSVLILERVRLNPVPNKQQRTKTMKTIEQQQDQVRQAVRARYGQIAVGGGGCCGPTGCGGQPANGEPDPAAISQRMGYSPSETSAVPEGANLGLGCGNPQALAAIKPGEIVLDLGSGAGFDAFLAARAVGPSGRVIGVDMTPEMISKARMNQTKGASANVEFRLGEIENLPVADATADVVISNCVINLSPDKRRVFQEAFRVLKPGGRLAVSDIVALAPIPAELREDWALYTGCVSGASLVEEIRAMLRDAGFADIRIARKGESREIVGQWLPGRKVEDFVASASIEAVKPL
jgi:arsenite methyltransferase